MVIDLSRWNLIFLAATHATNGHGGGGGGGAV
jgi:hypothetical protein